jgi:hypothetical protein
MSRQFSSATVLRMVPNSLLALLFDRLGLGDLNIAWEKLGQREITQALKAINLLGRPEQDAVEGALRSVFDLACDAGIDAIFEAAAKTGDLDLPRQMPSDCGRWIVDRLLRTLLRRLECNPPRVSRVDLGGGASRLEQLGLIVPAEPARGVACQHCDGPYCLPVEFVRHVPSGTVHGYISCSQCGLSQVDPRQLDRWRVSAQGLLASVVSSLAGAARSPAVVIEEKLWSAGKLHLTVKTALQLINRFLAEDDFDADTQFCLHWFEQYGWESGKFGEADTLARAKGTSVEGVKQAGVLHAAGGNVRLLKWREYPSDWDPRTDPRLFQAIDAVDRQGQRKRWAGWAPLAIFGVWARWIIGDDLGPVICNSDFHQLHSPFSGDLPWPRMRPKLLQPNRF